MCGAISQLTLLTSGHHSHLRQVAQLWQRDRATVVCCAYVRKVHCQLLYVRPALHRMCLYRIVGVFRRGCVTFGEYLTGKGALPTNQCWCQKTRVIALSRGIKISAVHHLNFVTIHASDRQTDGRTELQEQYHALHYMQLHGKNH